METIRRTVASRALSPLFRRLLLCLAIAAAPCAQAADAWTEEGGSAGATSFNPDQTAIGPGNIGTLVERWSRKLGDWQWTSPAAIADGAAYVIRELENPDFSVYYQLLRLDLASGATAWKSRVPSGLKIPAVAGDLVIVAGGGPDGGNHAHVVAFDSATGTPRWRYLLPGNTGTFLPPHVQGATAFATTGDGKVVALDTVTGLPRWNRKLNIFAATGLALGEGVVVIGHFDGLRALDAADGQERWRYKLPNSTLTLTHPVVVGDTALIYAEDGPLHAVDAATGAVRWVQATPPGDQPGALEPVASDGQRVFALNGLQQQTLSALDLATGATLWSRQAVGPAAHGMVVSNGMLILSTDKQLLAFDPATGAPLPMPEFKGHTAAKLSIAEGHLVKSGGPVQAIGLPD